MSAHILEPVEAQRLRARTPTRGDLLEIVGFEPAVDLAPGTTGAVWRKAVFDALRNGAITPPRAVGLLRGTLSEDELPQVDIVAEP